ncbi:ORFx protein [NL63-related bat coronavirus]|uniref:ORFx protein n=1 Tax=NL63-related bat coronavirus TaxID=1920748 RepID=A0A1L2KGC9_9ALPC|nr:ORFx protein [NL63-related bat coronavirus]APD51488.1 ORFx protein [NL63-related bat coronavirus]
MPPFLLTLAIVLEFFILEELPFALFLAEWFSEFVNVVLAVGLFGLNAIFTINFFLVWVGLLCMIPVLHDALQPGVIELWLDLLRRLHDFFVWLMFC